MIGSLRVITHGPVLEKLRDTCLRIVVCVLHAAGHRVTAERLEATD